MVENIFYSGKQKGLIDSVTMEKTKIILKQMENSICKVFGKNIGTGFFCLIQINDEKIPVLMTNYHIIDENFIKFNNQVKIQLNNDQVVKYITINKDKIIYSSEIGKYDLTIIKIDSKEKIYNNQYLELDDALLKDQSEKIYEDKTIYILNYNNEGQAVVSYGYGVYEKNKKNNFDFIHKCNIELGSSGAPILNLSTNKVIGMHKYIYKDINDNLYNLGIILKYPLIEFENNKNKTILEEGKEVFQKKLCDKNPKDLLYQSPNNTFKNIKEDKEEKKNNSPELNSKSIAKLNKNNYDFNRIKKEFNISKNTNSSRKNTIEPYNSFSYKETNVDSKNKMNNLNYYPKEKKEVNKNNINQSNSWKDIKIINDNIIINNFEINFVDIIKELSENEEKYSVDPQYMLNKSDINKRMRAILIDWLIDVQVKYKLLPQTMYITVNLIDRYLSKVNVNTNILQLVGITALFIACKYEEKNYPNAKEFAHLADGAYDKSDLLNFELKMLSELNFEITYSVQWTLFVIYKIKLDLDNKTFFFAWFLMELCLIDYDILNFKVNEIVASTILIAAKSTGVYKSNWFKDKIGIDENNLQECCEEIYNFYYYNANHNLQAARSKFSKLKYLQAAKIKIC